jgi:hypothetical protein
VDLSDYSNPQSGSGHRRLQNIIRWSARILSVPFVLLGFGYIFLIGILLGGMGGILPIDALIMFLAAILSIGLVIAWWKEILGACVALISPVSFFILLSFFPGFRNFYPFNPFTPLVLIVPECLFFASWFLQERQFRSFSPGEILWFATLMGLIPNLLVAATFRAAILENLRFMMIIRNPILIWLGINLGIITILFFMRRQIKQRVITSFALSSLITLSFGTYLIALEFKGHYYIPTVEEKCTVVLELYEAAEEVRWIDSKDPISVAEKFLRELTYNVNPQQINKNYQFVDQISPVLENIEQIEEVIQELKGQTAVGESAEEIHSLTSALEALLDPLVAENCNPPTQKEKCTAVQELSAVARKGWTIKTHKQANFYRLELYETLHFNYKIFHFMDSMSPIVAGIDQIQLAIQELHMQDPVGEKAEAIHSLVLSLSAEISLLRHEVCSVP